MASNKASSPSRGLLEVLLTIVMIICRRNVCIQDLGKKQLATWERSAFLSPHKEKILSLMILMIPIV
jgi:hypothetical protein